MNDLLYTLLVFTGGFALGGFFFGGLWLTVSKVPTSERPALLMLGSFLIRTGLLIAGFFIIGAGDWLRFTLCLLGFVTARYMVVLWTRKGTNSRIKVPERMDHEV
jgi:F1F0 ATPase subunit 2